MVCIAVCAVGDDSPINNETGLAAEGVCSFGILMGDGEVKFRLGKVSAINDHEVEQWSRLPPNTRNLGRDSRISPKGHGPLTGPKSLERPGSTEPVEGVVFPGSWTTWVLRYVEIWQLTLPHAVRELVITVLK